MATIVEQLKAIVSADISSYTRSMKQVQNQAKGTSVAMKAFGIGGAAAFAIFGRQAWKAAMDFDRAMSEVETIVDTTVTSIEDIERTVLDMSVAMGVDAAEQARAYYQTISAGITDTTDALVVLEAATRLSVVTFTRQETVVEGISAVLNAYNMQASEATRISNILFKTVQLGVTRLGPLKAALAGILPIAASLQLPLEQLTAALATLTLGGMDVHRAGTGLRQILVSILKPTDEAKKEAARLGIDFGKTALQTQGLIGFLQELNDTAEVTTVKFEDLFGNVRALPAILSLAAGQFDKFKELLTKMQDETDAAGEAILKMNERFSRQWKKLMAWGMELLRGQGRFVQKALVGTAQLAKTWKAQLTDLAWAFAGLQDTLGLQNIDPWVESLENGQLVVKLLVDHVTQLTRAQRERLEVFTNEIQAINDVMQAEQQLRREREAAVDESARWAKLAAAEQKEHLERTEDYLRAEIALRKKAAADAIATTQSEYRTMQGMVRKHYAELQRLAMDRVKIQQDAAEAVLDIHMALADETGKIKLQEQQMHLNAVKIRAALEGRNFAEARRRLTQHAALSSALFRADMNRHKSRINAAQREMDSARAKAETLRAEEKRLRKGPKTPEAIGRVKAIKDEIAVLRRQWDKAKGQRADAKTALDEVRDAALARITAIEKAQKEAIAGQTKDQKRFLEIATEGANRLRAILGDLQKAAKFEVEADTKDALTRVWLLQAELAKIKDKTITITVNWKDIGKPPVGGPVQEKQHGGIIRPAGGVGRDRVPALLEPGEFVVRRAVAQQFRPLLEAINQRAGILPTRRELPQSDSQSLPAQQTPGPTHIYFNQPVDRATIQELIIPETERTGRRREQMPWPGD